MKTRTLKNRRASFVLLGALVMAYSFICLTKNCFSSSMVFIVDAGLLNKPQTGLITASFYVVYAILQIVGGTVTDKWHPERFITFGFIGAGICNLVIFFNQNYTVMLVMWSLNAAAQFAVWPAIFKLLSTMTTPDMRNNSLFIITFSNPVGVVIGYGVAALVGSNWQFNFLISAVGLITLAIVWEITFRSIAPNIEEVEIEQSGDPLVKTSENFSFAKVVLTSGIPLMLAVSFIRCMFDLGIKALTPTMIYEMYDSVSPSLATVLNIVVLVAGACGPVLAHILYPKYIKNEAIALTIFLGIATPFILMTLLIGQVSYWFIVIDLALIVMMMGAGTLFTTTFIATRYNKYGKGATVAGILNCSASFGVVAANTIYTAIAENFGWYATIAVWIILMVTALILSAIMIPIWGRFLKN